MPVKNKNKNKNNNTNKNSNKNNIHININTEKRKRKRKYSNKKGDDLSNSNKINPNPTIINNYITNPKQEALNSLNAMLTNEKIRNSRINDFSNQTQYNDNTTNNPIVAEIVRNQPIINAERIRRQTTPLNEDINEMTETIENPNIYSEPAKYNKTFKSDIDHNDDPRYNSRIPVSTNKPKPKVEQAIDHNIYSEPIINKEDIIKPSEKVNNPEILEDKSEAEQIKEIKKFIKDSGYKNKNEYNPKTDNNLSYLKGIKNKVEKWKAGIDFLGDNGIKIDSSKEYDFNYIIEKHRRDKKAIEENKKKREDETKEK